MIHDKITHWFVSTKKYLIPTIVSCIVALLVHSCANMAAPSGGDYDFDPPQVVKSTPTPNATQVKSGKIEIVFDELVQIEKPSEKVIITPPQTKFPIIRAQNNKIIVQLKDTLLPNTTYTIDFTDAIADNNEKNTLENFAISFSTGDVIDSLAISGKVLEANNLEPVAGIYVGIHSDLSDSAFTTTPFLRISRTNELGEFTIKGVSEGRYKLYALNDMNRSYKYDIPSEAIAFLDTIIVPYAERSIRYDSIFSRDPKDPKLLKLDSLVAVGYNRYLPDDIVLRSFTSDFKRQYLQKHERQSDDVISIFFGAATEMPKIESLNPNLDIDKWSILERTVGNDTLKYWITNPDITNMDTLTLKVSYHKTDSLNIPQMTTDTLNFVNRNKRNTPKKEKEKKKQKKEEVKYLTLSTDIGQTIDIFKTINIEFDYPTSDLSKEKIRLEHLIDSTYAVIPFDWKQDSLNPRKYQLAYDWKPGEVYRISADSASIHSYNGLWNDKLDTSFKVKSLDQYGNLYINIESLPKGMPAFVELLDKADTPVRRANVEDGGALFMNLDPGIYYARIILDANGNGKWDPGDYSKKQEPEMVYYYDKSFDIKANWDIEEDWDILAIPLDKQKPLEITKNKPKGLDSRKKQMERRDAQEQKNRAQERKTQNNMNTNNNYNNRNNNAFR